MILLTVSTVISKRENLDNVTSKWIRLKYNLYYSTSNLVTIFIEMKHPKQSSDIINQYIFHIHIFAQVPSSSIFRLFITPLKALHRKNTHTHVVLLKRILCNCRHVESKSMTVKSFFIVIWECKYNDLPRAKWNFFTFFSKSSSFFLYIPSSSMCVILRKWNIL